MPFTLAALIDLPIDYSDLGSLGGPVFVGLFLVLALGLVVRFWARTIAEIRSTFGKHREALPPPDDEEAEP